jgi:hypothetical protein
MNNLQDIVLQLIRKAVNPQDTVNIPKGVDWSKVIDISMKQGVIGITFDTITQLRE